MLALMRSFEICVFDSFLPNDIPLIGSFRKHFLLSSPIGRRSEGAAIVVTLHQRFSLRFSLLQSVLLDFELPHRLLFVDMRAKVRRSYLTDTAEFQAIFLKNISKVIV